MAEPVVSKLPDIDAGPSARDGVVDTAASAARVTPPAPSRVAVVAAPAPLRTSAAEPNVQEVDRWWGSYSPWTMMPSMLVCIALTGLIAWAAWLRLPRGLAQVTIVGLAGAVWLFQIIRWCYRVFGYNYRMTSRRLYCSKGVFLTRVQTIHLADVALVQVKFAGHGKMLDVGKIIVRVDDAAQPPLVLDGVRSPERMAERIRELVHKARAAHVTQARVSSV
jgi:hypothetical protein